MNYRKQFALHLRHVDVLDTAQYNGMSILVYHTNNEITIPAPFNEHEHFFTTQATATGGCWVPLVAFYHF